MIRSSTLAVALVIAVSVAIPTPSAHAGNPFRTAARSTKAPPKPQRFSRYEMFRQNRAFHGILGGLKGIRAYQILSQRQKLHKQHNVIPPASDPHGHPLLLGRFGKGGVHGEAIRGAYVNRLKPPETAESGRSVFRGRMITRVTRYARKSGQLAVGARVITDKRANMTVTEKVRVSLARRAIVRKAIQRIDQASAMGDVAGLRDALEAIETIRLSGKLGHISRLKTYFHLMTAKRNSIGSARSLTRQGNIGQALRLLEVADGLGGGKSTKRAARALAGKSAKVAAKLAKAGMGENAVYALDLASALSAYGGRRNFEPVLSDAGFAAAKMLARKGITGNEFDYAYSALAFAAGAAQRGGLEHHETDERIAQTLLQIAEASHGLLNARTRVGYGASREERIGITARAVAYTERYDGRQILSRRDRLRLVRIARALGRGPMKAARIAIQKPPPAESDGEPDGAVDGAPEDDDDDLAGDRDDDEDDGRRPRTGRSASL